MKKFLFLIELFLLISIACFSQKTIGIPKIINYSHEEMNAGTQNWNIAQDNAGTIYFANNGGLATYNGKEWKIFGLPNKTIVRSVCIDSDGKIYVGGQDIFGYFFPDKNGVLKFYSKSDELAADLKEFGDVWSITIYNNKVFYRTSRRIFEYANGKFSVHENNQNDFWSSTAISNDKLYAYNNNQGLYVYNGSHFIKTSIGPFDNSNATAILEYNKDTLLLSTLKNGVFLFTNNKTISLPVAPLISEAQIYTASKIDDNLYALGTVNKGIFLIDKKGNTKGNISSENGLTNNIILSLFLDKQKNLWAGLDDGVTLININSAIKTIFPHPGNRTTTYAVNAYKGNLYIGASDGLYKTKLTIPEYQDLSFSMNAFEKMPGTDGQIWGLNTIDDKLLVGHHEGAFQIENNSLIKYNTPGAWIYKELPRSKNVVLGTYYGLYFLKNQNTKFIIDNFYNKTTESLRFVEVDSIHNLIWASHPYRGIYKLTVSPDFMNILSVELLNSKNGLPTDLNNFVYKIDNEIVFATENGVYLYDHSSKKFIVDKKFTSSIGNRAVAYMIQDKEGNIWFVSNELPGMIKKNNTKAVFFPELRGKLVGGFYTFYPLNNRNIFIGSNNGVIHLNLEKYNASPKPLSISFNKIVSIASNKDSLLNNGYFINENNIIETVQPKNLIPSLPAKNRSIHFEFVANDFIDNNTTYSYKLEGFDENWSGWSLKSEKDYTNLPHGKYTFRVKAQDNFGNKSPEIYYTFYIKPFWYQTLFAKIVYAALLGLLFFLLMKFVSRKMKRQKEKFQKEQKQLKYLHELEIEHNEREIIDLKNKNLETEINYKNKELASITMNLYKKGRLLSKLKDDINDATKKVIDREQKRSFNKVIKQIEEAEKQSNDWEQFSIHFDDVHNNFLKRIKELYPDLTPAELKMAAYLKINLSSKEIAQILNISLKGVEVARYRLRKKLAIETDVNLVSFLNQI